MSSKAVHGTDAASGAERQYFDALAQGHFNIQRCGQCSRHVFHPREICPHCGADALGWVRPSGRGTVYSYTTVRRKPEAGGDYNVSLIDLEEGVRMMACVVGRDPHGVAIGMAVQARVDAAGGAARVVFEEVQP